MSRKVTFTFEGRRMEGEAGQSIGAALYANGVKTLSWSSKYRRPRGLRCLNGACPNCAVVVDGVQGVTSCLRPLRGGETIERQRPFAKFLPLNRLSRFAPAGFYYERLAHSPRLWRRAERVLARLAGVAALAESGSVPIGGHSVREVDRLIVGGGRRGLAAAAEAAEAGAAVVVLIEREERLGGRLLDSLDGKVEATELARRVAAAGVEVRTGATYLGVFEEGLAAVVDAGGLTSYRAVAVAEFIDGLDLEHAFPDGDRPGVLLGGGLARLLVREGVAPGRAGVVVGSVEERAPLVERLRTAGVAIVAEGELSELGAAHGREELDAVTLAGRKVSCDFLVLATGRDQRVLREVPG